MKSEPSHSRGQWLDPGTAHQRSKSFGSISKVATRKLALLDAAATLDFLRSPPGNHLEALERDRLGQHSIRINDQWRVCFRWTAAGPEDVKIVDYH